MSATIKHINIDDIDIPVIFEKQSSLPILNLQMVFKNSGHINDEKKAGLANISSKLLNEGTKKLGSVKFAQKLEENAISLHATNGTETFVIELSSLKDSTNKALKLLNSLIKSPNYSNEVLEKIKTIQAGVLKRKENDYDYVAQNLLNKLLFSKTALATPNLGTLDSISKITLEDVKNNLNKSLVLENLILVVGGDLDFEEFKTLILPTLKLLKKGKKSKLPTIKVSNKKQEETLLKDTQQAYIYFGSNFNTDFKNENNYKAKVASFILGGSGFGSRLMEEIRVKRGLAYSAYGSISINKSNSHFTGYLQTKNENAKEAKDLVENIIKYFVKKGVTQEELDAAKNFLMGSEPLRNETLSQRLSKAFTIYYRGLDTNYFQKELDNIKNLSLEDLNEYIKSHKELENLTFTIVRK